MWSFFQSTLSSSSTPPPQPHVTSLRADRLSSPKSPSVNARSSSSQSIAHRVPSPHSESSWSPVEESDDLSGGPSGHLDTAAPSINVDCAMTSRKKPNPPTGPAQTQSPISSSSIISSSSTNDQIDGSSFIIIGDSLGSSAKEKNQDQIILAPDEADGLQACRKAKALRQRERRKEARKAEGDNINSSSPDSQPSVPRKQVMDVPPPLPSSYSGPRGGGANATGDLGGQERKRTMRNVTGDSGSGIIEHHEEDQRRPYPTSQDHAQRSTPASRQRDPYPAQSSTQYNDDDHPSYLYNRNIAATDSAHEYTLHENANGAAGPTPNQSSAKQLQDQGKGKGKAKDKDQDEGDGGSVPEWLIKKREKQKAKAKAKKAQRAQEKLGAGGDGVGQSWAAVLQDKRAGSASFSGHDATVSETSSFYPAESASSSIAGGSEVSRKEMGKVHARNAKAIAKRRAEKAREEETSSTVSSISSESGVMSFGPGGLGGQVQPGDSTRSGGTTSTTAGLTRAMTGLGLGQGDDSQSEASEQGYRPRRGAPGNVTIDRVNKMFTWDRQEQESDMGRSPVVDMAGSFSASSAGPVDTSSNASSQEAEVGYGSQSYQQAEWTPHTPSTSSGQRSQPMSRNTSQSRSRSQDGNSATANARDTSQGPGAGTPTIFESNDSFAEDQAVIDELQSDASDLLAKAGELFGLAQEAEEDESSDDDDMYAQVEGGRSAWTPLRPSAEQLESRAMMFSYEGQKVMDRAAVLQRKLVARRAEAVHKVEHRASVQTLGSVANPLVSTAKAHRREMEEDERSVAESFDSEDRASETIDMFLMDEVAFMSEKSNKLALWQSLCIELGVARLSPVDDSSDDIYNFEIDPRHPQHSEAQASHTTLASNIAGSSDRRNRSIDSDGSASDASDHTISRAPTPTQRRVQLEEHQLPIVPNTLTGCHRLLKGDAHVNLRDYWTVRAENAERYEQAISRVMNVKELVKLQTEGREALKALVFPTAGRMANYTRADKKNRVASKAMAKREWLNPLMRTIYNFPRTNEDYTQSPL